jgi:hypothetical protein
MTERAARPGRPIRLTVSAGRFDRSDAIARARLGLRHGTAVRLHEPGGAGGPVPAQVDADGDLVWVLDGPIAAHASRSFVAEVEEAAPAVGSVVAELHPALVAITCRGRPVAQYNYTSVWKPYFCPLMGPTGNVVRGASAEHQHQAGLFCSYGGHFTPTNIWSDWDEPIYGPDGKMLDRGFELVAGGPVFAQLIQRIGYMAADGSFVLEERRDMRLFPLPGGVTVLDLIRTCSRPQEPSLGPFNLSCRVADPLRTVDMARRGPPPDRTMLPTENPGKMESSSGAVSQGESLKSERWLDRSGQLPGGWGGLAFFDHPSNPGYPGRLSAAGYGTMGLGYDFPEGSTRATWRYRVYAHAGDATAARIEARWRDYASPPDVALA